jgi:hypothetical protein
MDHFEAIKRVVVHLVKAVVNQTPPQIPSALVRFYDQLVDSAFIPFRLQLYRLLRLCLAVCPADSTIAAIGSVWLDFIAPWRVARADENGISRMISDDMWDEYVQNNFFFYHTLAIALFNYVLAIVESFGLAVDPSCEIQAKEGRRTKRVIAIPGRSLPSETAETIVFPILCIFRHVLQVLSRFHPLLRNIEDLLRRNNAQPIRDQMSVLEVESFQLTFLFDESFMGVPLRMLYWLEVLHGAIPGAATEDSSQRTRLGHDDPDFGTSTSGNIHSTIIQCEEELCEIFSIREEQFESFAESFSIRNAYPSKPIPSSSPGLRPRGIALMATMISPEERLRYKMGAPVTVDNRVIKSYELPLLVELSGRLSRWCNYFWSQALEKYPDAAAWLPLSIRLYHFDFRFFAAYPNLIFVGCCLLAAKLLCSMLF